MSTIQIEITDQLRAEIAGLVAGRGMSESEWMQEAVREKLAAETKLASFKRRAARASRREYEAVLAKVPDVDPIPGDEC